MKKRLIALLLVLAMMATLFVGCGQQADPNTPNETKAPASETKASAKDPDPVEDGGYLNELGQLPLVTSEQTLKIAIHQDARVSSYEDNYLTKYIKEQTGINIEFVLLPMEEYTTKINLMVSGGEELPDIIFATGSYALPADAILSYGQGGQFLDLKELFAENTYFCKQIPYMTEADFDYILNKVTSVDGGMYGFPSYDSSLGGIGQFDWAVNVEWLDYLGLDMPKTLDEFTQMLIAFRDGDPNQNGIKDEIPWYDDKDWNAETWYQLINMFVYYDPYYHVNVTDGDIWVPYTTEEFKEALKYLKMLVEEELLSPLVFAQAEGETTKLKVDQDGVAVVGLMGAYAGWMANDTSFMRQYDYMPLFEGPVGTKYSPNRPNAATLTAFVTSDCEDPVLAVRFLDWLSTQRLYTRYGEPGVNFMAREDDPEAFDAQFPYLCALGQTYGADKIYAVMNDPWTVAEGATMNVNWCEDTVYFAPGIWTAGQCQADPVSATREELIANNASDGDYVNYLYWAKGPDRNGAIPEEVVYDLKFNAEEIDEALTIQTELSIYVKECIASFIVGTMDIDTQWEEYLAALESIGLSQYLDYAQAAYDRG